MPPCEILCIVFFSVCAGLQSTTGNIRVEPDGTLSILNLTSNLFDQYICVASNYLGSKSSVFEVRQTLGSWASWSAWGSCMSTQCGALGVRIRTRTCSPANTLCLTGASSENGTCPSTPLGCPGKLTICTVQLEWCSTSQHYIKCRLCTQYHVIECLRLAAPTELRIVSSWTTTSGQLPLWLCIQNVYVMSVSASTNDNTQDIFCWMKCVLVAPTWKPTLPWKRICRNIFLLVTEC